jgi:hypothetical protein
LTERDPNEQDHGRDRTRSDDPVVRVLGFKATLRCDENDHPPSDLGTYSREQAGGLNGEFRSRRDALLRLEWRAN